MLDGAEVALAYDGSPDGLQGALRSVLPHVARRDYLRAIRTLGVTHYQLLGWRNGTLPPPEYDARVSLIDTLLDLPLKKRKKGA